MSKIKKSKSEDKDIEQTREWKLQYEKRNIHIRKIVISSLIIAGVAIAVILLIITINFVKKEL